MKKAFLFSDDAKSKEEIETIKKRLMDYAKSAQLEAVGIISGKFATIKALDAALSKLKNRNIHILLFDSAETILNNFNSIADLKMELKKHDITACCVSSGMTLGAEHYINLEPHHKNAWIMTNGQSGVLDSMKRYAAEHDLNIKYIDEEAICCEYEKFHDRTMKMLMDKTEVILVPDDVVFGNYEDRSLHALTGIAIDQGIDIIAASLDYNITEAIEGARAMFSFLTEEQKRKVALISRSATEDGIDITEEMNEFSENHGYDPVCFIEISGTDNVPESVMKEAMEYGVEVVLIDERLTISEDNKNLLKTSGIELLIYEQQEQKQSFAGQQYQA